MCRDVFTALVSQRPWREGGAGDGKEDDKTFLNFTFEEESMMNSLRDDFALSRVERRK